MANHHEPLPTLVHESAMDYHQHEQTYDGFVTLVKYAILHLAILVVGLYTAIIAGQLILGLFLVVMAVLIPIVLAMLSRQ